MTTTVDAMTHAKSFPQDSRLLVEARIAVQNDDVEAVDKLIHNPDSGFATLGFIFGEAFKSIPKDSALAAYKDQSNRKIIGSLCKRVLTDENLSSTRFFFSM